MKIKYSDMNIQFTLEHTLIDVQNIIFEHLSRTIPTHSHGNNCYEIHYISSGYGTLKANGKTFEILPNTLYITGPHIEHSQTPLPNDPMQEYCIYLKLHNTGSKRQAVSIVSSFTDTSFWFGQDTQNINNIMQQLFNELKHKYTGYRNQVEALLTQLIICLVRNYEHSNNSSHHNPTNPQTDKTAIIIEECFLYEYPTLTLQSLANQLKLSTRQTQRLLLDNYGKTFQQKKTEARMSAAAILLEDKTQSITSISSLLGYSSVEHFSSAFHKYYQICPREYRKTVSS